MGVEIIVLTICLILAIFFSIAETSFISISQMKVSQLVEQKIPGSKIVKKLKDEPSRFLSIVLIGNNIANIGASVLATSLIISFFESRGEASVGTVLGVATVLITVFIIVFCEIIPKNIAIRNAEKITILFAWPILIFSVILTPIAIMFTWISTPFVSLFGGKISEKGPFLTEEDLRFLIATSEKEGIIEKKEREMISSIFDFADTTVKEVMTPRPDVKGVEDSESIDELLKIIRETGHSRIPVYEGNLDNIVGVVYAKDLLNSLRSESIRDYMRSIIFIPEGKKVDELLRQMQANRTHIAVVVDEYGVTSGIVSMEDIVEQLFGEIYDEHESGELLRIRSEESGTYLIKADTTMQQIKDELDLDINRPDLSCTLAAFLIEQLGTIPTVGETIEYPFGIFSIVTMKGKRIESVRLQPIVKEEEPQRNGFH